MAAPNFINESNNQRPRLALLSGMIDLWSASARGEKLPHAL